jgi:prevent-host-death family protein
VIGFASATERQVRQSLMRLATVFMISVLLSKGQLGGCATLCHMDVSVRELRNHTARVIAAVESGERVVLTVHGRPVADIVPRRERSERRSTDLLLSDLAQVSALAARLGVNSPARDFDVGLTTDDMMP